MKFTKKIFGSKFANQFVAEVMGKRAHLRPYAWQRGEQSYSHITGGIAMPTMDQPGFLLTVGVRNLDNQIECIEEHQDESEVGLIRQAKDIQKDYGHGVIQQWWGNTEALMPLVHAVGGAGMVISTPPNYHDSDAFQLYLSQLRVAVAGLKNFWIKDCQLLRGHIESFVKEKAARKENSPAVAVAGWLCHTLASYRPWEQSLERTDLLPTTSDGFEIYADERVIEETERALWGQI